MIVLDLFNIFCLCLDILNFSSAFLSIWNIVIIIVLMSLLLSSVSFLVLFLLKYFFFSPLSSFGAIFSCFLEFLVILTRCQKLWILSCSMPGIFVFLYNYWALLWETNKSLGNSLNLLRLALSHFYMCQRSFILELNFSPPLRQDPTEYSKQRPWIAKHFHSGWL